ncbi:MAG TPA: cupredoxin domain-containing protein [Gemmatimonadaceae bacterium]|nr:cupredoxin domain-containing protein [Gemmatimonadaceae bacterium]
MSRGKRRRRALAAVLALILGPASIGAAPRPRKPVTHRVAIEGTRFKPELLTVKAGDSVVWTNKDPFSHTATSQTGRFDSKAIEAGKAWRFVTVKKGDFAYICTYHTTMKGRLRVE